jgi:membrane protease subunit HflK
MDMNGLDRGKATDDPAKDGLGVAQHDSPWGGAEAVPAPREVDPPPPGDAAAEAPPGDPPVPAKPQDAAPPAPNPWHHSRPGRAARPARRGATAPGTIAVAGLVRRLGRIPVPHLRPPLGTAWTPWLGGALVLLWLGTTSLHPVGPQEQAIVSTFGAWGPALGPGVAVSWPWPIGAARVEDVTTVRRLSLPEGEGEHEHLILTRDAGLVDLGYDVRWRISDLRRHAAGLADPAATLRLAADTAMRATLAGMDFPAVMGGGQVGSGHEALGHEAARRLQALLDQYQAGIMIDGVDIRRADPPARVADGLRAVAAARTEAGTEAAQAKSWSQQWIVHAQGEAGAFDQVYAQYRRAPDITRRQMYYATMDRVLGQSDKVIVDAPGTTTTLPPFAAPGAEPPPHNAKAGDGR